MTALELIHDIRDEIRRRSISPSRLATVLEAMLDDADAKIPQDLRERLEAILIALQNANFKIDECAEAIRKLTAGDGSGSITAGEADHAREADHAKSAYDLDPDSPVRSLFLSKTKPDSTPYSLTVGSLHSDGKITAKDTVRSDNFLAGLFGGTGWGVDRRGNAEFESAVIRSALTVMQLIINEQTVSQGDTIYTEGDTIESCEPETDDNGNPVINADGTPRWWLHMKPRYDGYTTAIQPGMVILGTVNNLFDAAIPGAPSYYKAWMRVNGPELGTSGNRLNVTLYPDDEVPAGRNYPPCPLMTLARWGHQTLEELQRLFRLSSHEGTLVRYDKVNKPIIDLGNVASLIGRMPEGLLTPEEEERLGVKPGEEVIYSRTFLGNFIQLSHKGKPLATVVWTGEYDPTRVYKFEHWVTDPDTGRRTFVTESCTYCGCTWICQKDGIQGIAPGYGVTSWAFKEGNDTFTVDFEEKQIIYSPEQLDTFGATLTLTARWRGQDVLKFVKAKNVTWSRESYDRNGSLRAVSDAAWKPRTDNDNKRLLLDKRDLDYDGTVCSKITFTARVALDDTTVTPAEAAMDFTM